MVLVCESFLVALYVHHADFVIFVCINYSLHKNSNKMYDQFSGDFSSPAGFDGFAGPPELSTTDHNNGHTHFPAPPPPDANLNPALPASSNVAVPAKVIDLNPQTNPDLAMKMNAWAMWCRDLTGFKFELEVEQQRIEGMAVTPITFEDIPAAEAALASMKQAKDKMESLRKDRTGKLNTVIESLMAYEKKVAVAIVNLTNQIIGKKTELKAANDLKKNKEQEVKTLTEQAGNHYATAHAHFLNTVLTIVDQSYTYALGPGNVTPEQVESFLDQIVRPKLKDVQFVPALFQYYAQFNDQPITQAIIDNAFKTAWTREQYLQYFEEQTALKYSDYAIAYQNKEAALATHNADMQSKKDEVADDQTAATIANKMLSSATSLAPSAEPVIDTKDLKESYKVIEPESLLDALHIMAAFGANVDLVKTKLKVTKWGSFTVSQMANALSKVKCDDNNFAPDHIKFEKVTKL